jgi:putative transcriptional regulator
MASSEKPVAAKTGGGLEGSFLIAMPGIGDARFHRSVIFICAHSNEGAMGLIINQPSDGLKFDDLLGQLDIDPTEGTASNPVIKIGGPVESSRGFVLHSPDYGEDGALEIDGGYRLTGTVDILRDIARGKGPAKHMIALGYTGWAPGQLEQELQQNGWLSCDAEAALIFDTDDEAKWVQALSKLGISPELLSAGGGSA